MKITTMQLVTTAAILAICVISQFFKNLSVYITGPIINACLIICLLSCGLVCALCLCIITPVTSFIITGSPIMAAVPAIIPCIMLGNALIVLSIYFFNDGFIHGKFALPVSMGIGSVIKAAFMWVEISLILLPRLLPEAMLPKLSVIQTTFSLTQLITAVTGSVIAYIVWIPLKKSLATSE